MGPTKCLSSLLTTELLRFRNPHGGEENWLTGNQREGYNSALYYGKVVTTEIGVSLLCVTAAVETVAYLALAIASLPLLCLSMDISKKFFDLTSSAGFTLFWNVGNASVFNLFCENLFTEESFARYSIDHWPRGQAFKALVIVAQIALNILCIVVARQSSPSMMNTGWVNEQWLRRQDFIFFADWCRRHQRNLTLPVLGPLQQDILPNLQLNNIVRLGNQLNQSIDAGATFFKENILEGIAPDTKELIQSFDADICHFILTKTVYIYVFGAKKEAPLPNFLKQDTKDAIQALRTKYANNLDKGKDLQPVMENHLLFRETQSDPSVEEVLNEMKLAGSKELQNTLFLTRCWQKALNL